MAPPLAAVLWLAAVSVAGAASGPWWEGDDSAVRLIAASEAVGEGSEISLGLHFRLDEGWKIYWRSPGDAGYPPQPDWKGSGNLEAAVLSWPVPERFSILGYETLGYKHEVVLPVTATLSDPGRPLRLRAAVDYLACSEVCVPQLAELSLDLPEGPARPSEFAHIIDRFLDRVPGDGSAHGLAIEGVGVTGSGAGAVLNIAASALMPFVDPDVFIEGPAELNFAPPKVRLGGDRLGVLLKVKVGGAENLPGGLAGTTLTVTVVDGQRAAEMSLVVDAGMPAAETIAEGSKPLPLLVILVLAMIGGLILNLMPCVLPVLSIKILGVISHGGGDRREVRLSFLATTAGILFSFLFMAAALVALKEAGMVVGWGIQFQQTWFLVALTLVVVLFACNLWGFFEFRLPRWVADAGAGNGTRVRGVSGHFLTGAFATVLATPCSAPFLGTAVGFALSSGTFEIMAVFTALGVGLSLPYLAVAAMPELATRLPRPGPWMVTLRRVLGFALAGTGVWLLSVVAAQVGVMGAVVIGIFIANAAVVLYMRRGWPRWLRSAGMGGVVGLAVLAFLVPGLTYRFSGMGLEEAGPRLDAFWTAFDEAAIPQLVDDGKVVFVDVTAEWCITCKVNKTFVLHRGEVAVRLGGLDVVAMQADWTRPSRKIADYLATFGRYGIPFDAVYGPALPEGMTLPELLTEGIVLEALDRATGK